MLPSVSDRRIVTYGFAGQADVRGDNVLPIPGGNRFDVTLRTFGAPERRYEGLELPMPGRHNVLNALAAIGVADQLGIGEAQIREGFGKFGGVKRRFTKVGELSVGGGTVTIIDDYGHHPVEVVAVVQPHRYTRLRDLFDDWRSAFNDADTVVIAPVYAAGEQPIEGISHETLAEALRRSGHRQVLTVSGEAELAPAIAPLLGAGDMVICLGAGDITKWAANLAGALKTAGAA
jgi:UDP-N-acetylmuramate--alanine ligase